MDRIKSRSLERCSSSIGINSPSNSAELSGLLIPKSHKVIGLMRFFV